jgi:UMF1 family MFS transporter
MAVILYVAASVGFAGGNIFYDSLLPGIADKSKVNYASSLGYALGYIGGGLLFLLNVLMFKFPETFGLSDSAAAIKLSFVSVAIWWALFSIPVMLFVREPQIYDRVPLSKAVTLGWKQLRDTLRDIRHLKVVGLFLLAYWFYIDGVDTIVKMAVDYGMSLNFEESALITALLIVQFVAFPAALIYNWFASRIGTKRAIEIAIMAYGFITLLGYFMKTEQHFFILAIMIGLFQGGIQALSRSLYTRLIPDEKSAEFFGFFNMLGKFAAVLGPLLMGSVTLLTGNARIGILSILILFAIGWVLLRKVNISEGERMAREFLAK